MLQIKQHYVKCEIFFLVREIQIIFRINQKIYFIKNITAQVGLLTLARGNYYHILFHHISFLPNPHLHFIMYTFIICMRYFRY